ncbi:hypothetical protein LIER_38126 [Lithospermum erythrorhizon]|uniref:DUF4283 domain-containing protein n=1 Tax=Lithospermum erythrorhizon TaxID=34254 RepID=A0AAV3PV74_LITER
MKRICLSECPDSLDVFKRYPDHVFDPLIRYDANRFGPKVSYVEEATDDYLSWFRRHSHVRTLQAQRETITHLMDIVADDGVELPQEMRWVEDHYMKQLVNRSLSILPATELWRWVEYETGLLHSFSPLANSWFFFTSMGTIFVYGVTMVAESDLARVLGSLLLEGEELEEVYVPDLAYDKVEEKNQFGREGSHQQEIPCSNIQGDHPKSLGGSSWGEPWLFEGYAIVLRRWEAEMQIDQVVFHSLPCWVQVWNFPLGYVEEVIGQAIVAHIGDVMEVDKRSIE